MSKCKDLGLLYDNLSAELADLTFGKSVLGTGCFLTGNYGLFVVASDADDEALFVELVLSAVDDSIGRNSHNCTGGVEVCALVDRSSILVVANDDHVILTGHALSVRSAVSLTVSGCYEVVNDHLSVSSEAVEEAVNLSRGVSSYLTGRIGVVYASVGIGEPLSCVRSCNSVLVTIVDKAVKKNLSALCNCAACSVADIGGSVEGYLAGLVYSVNVDSVEIGTNVNNTVSLTDKNTVVGKLIHYTVDLLVSGEHFAVCVVEVGITNVFAVNVRAFC